MYSGNNCLTFKSVSLLHIQFEQLILNPED